MKKFVYVFMYFYFLFFAEIAINFFKTEIKFVNHNANEPVN